MLTINSILSSWGFRVDKDQVELRELTPYKCKGCAHPGEMTLEDYLDEDLGNFGNGGAECYATSGGLDDLFSAAVEIDMLEDYQEGGDLFRIASFQIESTNVDHLLIGRGKKLSEVMEESIREIIHERRNEAFKIFEDYASGQGVVPLPPQTERSTRRFYVKSANMCGPGLPWRIIEELYETFPSYIMILPEWAITHVDKPTKQMTKKFMWMRNDTCRDQPQVLIGGKPVQVELVLDTDDDEIRSTLGALSKTMTLSEAVKAARALK